MIFSVCSAPSLSRIEFRTVRRSLNTPVLSIAELPIGPASAAIAAHVDPRDGLPRYTVAVRCERSREVVCFAVRERDLDLSEANVVAEAALSFAEGMGFLFEEEGPPITAETAAQIWSEYVGLAAPATSPEHSTHLLTKFRRSPSWTAEQSAAAVGFEPAARRAARSAGGGVESTKSRSAQPGGR